MKKIIGKELKGIKVLPDQELVRQNKEILADKVYMVFTDESCIEVRPLIDTDEIELSYLDTANFEQKGELVETLTQFKGMKCSYSWEARNSNGYFDCLIFAFDNLQPNILILSEGSVLKLFTIHPLR